MDLSLVLACYNEEPWLAASVAAIIDELDRTGWTYELILVDDGSRDRTPGVIREVIARHPRHAIRALFHPQNAGWGRTFADGVGTATGDVVGFLDVDLEIHPRHFVACCRAVRDGAAVAVGERSYAFVPQGVWRRLVSAGWSALVRLLLPVRGLEQTGSGCKAFRRADMLPHLAPITEPGWFLDLELMVRCRLAGLAIAMVPCVYVRNPAKPTTVRVVRDGWESLGRLLALRRRLRRAGLLPGRLAPSLP